MANFFDWATTISLGLLSLGQIFALGGWPGLGTPGLLAGSLIALAWLCHGFWWYFDLDRPRKIRWAGFLFFPLVLYMLGHAILSSVPWRAWPQIHPWLVGASAWWMLLHGVRTRHRWWALKICLASGIMVAFSLAVVQFYVQPLWLSLGRDTLGEFPGRASGTFALPDGLAALGLLLFYPLLLAGSLPRLAGVARFVCWALAMVCGLCLIYSGEKIAWILTLCGLVPLPLLLARDQRLRIQYTVRIVLLLIAGSLLLKIHGQDLWRALERGWTQSPHPYRQVLAAHQWTLPGGHPLFGAGPGTFPERWEKHVSETHLQVPSQALSGWAAIWQHFGIVGLLLLGLPLLWLIGRMAVQWWKEPWVHLSREEKERLQALETLHSVEKKILREGKKEETAGQVRRRKYRRKPIHKTLRKMPLVKIIFSGLFLGLVSFLLYGFWGSTWQFPALLLQCFFMAGLSLKYAAWREWEIPRHWHVRGLSFIVCLLLAGLFLVGSWRIYWPTTLAREARDNLQILMADPLLPRLEPEKASAMIYELESAWRWQPDNGDALADYLTGRLWMLRYSTSEPAPDPAELQSLTDELRRRLPGSSRAAVLQALAAAFLNAPWSEVRRYLAESVELNPGNRVYAELLAQAERLAERSKPRDFFYLNAPPPLPFDIMNGAGRKRDPERYRAHPVQ